MLNQTHGNVDIHVVDDGCPEGSQDAIADLLASERRLHFWIKENGGVASARNYGLARVRADADYVMFLDADDALKPGAIAAMLAILESDKTAGMVHCEPEFIDEDGRVVTGRSWLPRYAWRGSRVVTLGPEDKETPFESVYALAGVIPTLTLFRREVLDRTPGYDEKFGQHFEDTDLNLQVAIRSRVVYTPEQQALYRVRKNQSSADQSRHAPQLQKLRRKWHVMPGLSDEQRARVRFAEWFVDYPLAAKIGWETAKRAAAGGKWAVALRFGQGALRRLLTGKLCRPSG